MLRRLLLLGLALLLIPACAGSHPAPVFFSLEISATGGATTSDAVLGQGGAGGMISAVASGSVTMNGSTDGPEAPDIPSASDVGTELTNAMITAGTPIVGNVLVSSPLQIAAGVNPATITSSSGDVVIFSALIAERSAGSTTNSISISAPAGTIYVIGSIQTTGTPGVVDNPNGGNVTLSALRIVIIGTVDASGEAEASGPGGNGGVVTATTTGPGGSDILFTDGILRSSGGSGLSQGGTGGSVSLQAGGRLAVFAPIQTAGGSANNPAALATGGAGGTITLAGNGEAAVVTELLLAGGNATGFIGGAVGGAGGTFSAGSAAPYAIFGSIVTSGGNATTHAGTLTGGAAGPIQIGLSTPVSVLQLGLGTYSADGGFGVQGGGAGGGVSLASQNGDVLAAGTLSARGGDSTVNPGGPGGTVTVGTDQSAAGNTANHVLSFSGSVVTSSGAGQSASAPGPSGGPATFQSGGDLTWSGSVVTSGVTSNSGAGAVTFQIAAAHLVPSGMLSVDGSVTAEGAVFAGLVTPGPGGAVNLQGAVGVAFSGTLSTRGGGNTPGGAGSVTIQSAAGDVQLSGSIFARTDPSFTNPAPLPGNLTVSTPGSITVEGSIDLSSSPAVAVDSNSQGGAGGTLSVTSTGPGGSISLLPGTLIHCDGGSSSPGSLPPPGGAGGSVLLTTQSQPITLSGTMTARGGDSPAGSGGLGGQVVVNSNASGTGTGGNITLTSGSLIDVSGGNGLTGGSARNNGGVAPANSGGGNLAVVFDAAGGLTSAPDGTGGVVQNLGQIVALGYSVLGRGGDVWFDGQSAPGVELVAGNSGALNLAGPAGAGAFFPN